MLSADQSEKIGLQPILIYSQAQTGLNLCVTLIGLHLLYFYTDRRGLSPALAGLAFFIALVMDALTDPIVGNISDRARFKSGRRRPFFSPRFRWTSAIFCRFRYPITRETHRAMRDRLAARGAAAKTA